MTTVYVPDEHHLLRLVKPIHVMREDGEVTGIFPEAFKLRPDEDGLSSSWLEHYSGSDLDRIDATIAAFRAAMTIKPSHVFTRGNVGTIKKCCGECGVAIRVTHDPEPAIPGHSLVRRYSDTNDELLAALAAVAWAELHVVPKAG